MRLHVIDGLGYREVAERLRCCEANARQRVSRGLRRVALVLQERGLQLSSEVESMNTDIRYLQQLETTSSTSPHRNAGVPPARPPVAEDEGHGPRAAPPGAIAAGPRSRRPW